MILKDISFKTPVENILYDDVLLTLAEQDKGGEVLRLWESEIVFIVLGRICKTEDDLNIDAVLKDGIPVVRRSSGGGTVLQGKGCLNYSLILSKTLHPSIADLRQSYQYILGKVIAGLKKLDIEVVFQPVSDIALRLGYKKISGNAQRRIRNFILHHGTILYDFDLHLLEKYLKIPKSIPEYRRNRSHLEFVANVFSPESYKSHSSGRRVDDIKDSLRDVFHVERQERSLGEEEKESLLNLLKINKAAVTLLR
ncbi:MAG TPA: lipoate--protein ligase family protein [Candidatus Omnitrophica bacterium]|nr:MAG: hypothetical protein A2Z81_09075 [Omnitrophica WOR_2 bacterium GWA2_45_18]OGX21764.1 MAG: hypothetical protein A2Y04_01735 [Omnitrophica WOR_2 bacterium GWC2_45_7]HBR15305.1 lipoate--protein ligase family protein [Candidatus Omnitrophota bacterium]